MANNVRYPTFRMYAEHGCVYMHTHYMFVYSYMCICIHIHVMGVYMHAYVCVDRHTYVEVYVCTYRHIIQMDIHMVQKHALFSSATCSFPLMHKILSREPLDFHFSWFVYLSVVAGLHTSFSVPGTPCSLTKYSGAALCDSRPCVRWPF